jgi:hypothetical protein
MMQLEHFPPEMVKTLQTKTRELLLLQISTAHEMLKFETEENANKVIDISEDGEGDGIIGQNSSSSTGEAPTKKRKTFSFANAGQINTANSEPSESASSDAHGKAAVEEIEVT